MLAHWIQEGGGRLPIRHGGQSPARPLFVSTGHKKGRTGDCQPCRMGSAANDANQAYSEYKHSLTFRVQRYTHLQRKGYKLT